MWRNQKGFGWITLIIIIVIVIAVVAVGGWCFFGKGGLGFGGGKGDHAGDGNTADISKETEEITPLIEEIEYLSVSVSGNEYIYQNNKVSLDELITQLTNAEEKIPVRITDAEASRSAYTSLVEALRENNIRYIE